MIEDTSTLTSNVNEQKLGMDVYQADQLKASVGSQVKIMQQHSREATGPMLPSILNSPPQQEANLSVRTAGLDRSNGIQEILGHSAVEYFSSDNVNDILGNDSSDSMFANLPGPGGHMSASALLPSQSSTYSIQNGMSIGFQPLSLQDLNQSQPMEQLSGASMQSGDQSIRKGLPNDMDWMNQSKVRKRKQTSPLLSKFMEENAYPRPAVVDYQSLNTNSGYDYGMVSNTMYNGMISGNGMLQNTCQSGMYGSGMASNTLAPSMAWPSSGSNMYSSPAFSAQMTPTNAYGSAMPMNNGYYSSPGLIGNSGMYQGSNNSGIGLYGANSNSGPSMHMPLQATTIKVPMAPARSVQIETKKSVPLLLPFHHKNDNRIIPQTFHHQSFLLSPEEIYSVKSAFLSRIEKLDFENITVIELKTFLREFNLASGGKKSILVERIHQIAEWLRNERAGQPHNEAFLNQYHNDAASTSTFHASPPNPQGFQTVSADIANSSENASISIRQYQSNVNASYENNTETTATLESNTTSVDKSDDADTSNLPSIADETDISLDDLHQHVSIDSFIQL
jgi:hypothetical protein